jgi:hypothetical protein
MSEDRRTIKNWAARLSAADEMLSLDEARTLAAIAQADRLLEIRDVLQDVQMRLTRMELYASAHLPGYDDETQRMVLALTERTNGSRDA